MLASRLRLAVLGFALVCAASPALADSFTYKAVLKGSRETPPNDSKATGSVEAKYDKATLKLSWTVTYSGLSGPVTAAHFHGPAKPGDTAGPVITLEAPFDSPIKGEATLTPAQAADVAADLWYLNLHTAKFPQGEIRGQLK